MSLFNQIINALDNPEQEASTNQLNNILDTVQQLSGNYQTQPSAIESAMSVVGNFTRSALKEQRNQKGEAQVQQLINGFAGNQASSQALNALFSSSQLQTMIQQISGRTGLNARSIQGMLPILVPLVLNMLKTGRNTRTAQAGNPVLNSFLDTDGDGDVDVADAMRMASRYLRR